MINRAIKPIKGVNIADTKNQNKKDRPRLLAYKAISAEKNNKMIKAIDSPLRY